MNSLKKSSLNQVRLQNQIKKNQKKIGTKIILFRFNELIFLRTTYNNLLFFITFSGIKIYSIVSSFC